MAFLRGVNPSSKPTIPLVEVSKKEPVYTTEVVEGPRPDGSFTAQRFRDGIPEGPPIEVGSPSKLREEVIKRRDRNELCKLQSSFIFQILCGARA